MLMISHFIKGGTTGAVALPVTLQVGAQASEVDSSINFGGRVPLGPEDA